MSITVNGKLLLGDKYEVTGDTHSYAGDICRNGGFDVTNGVYSLYSVNILQSDEEYPEDDYKMEHNVVYNTDIIDIETLNNILNANDRGYRYNEFRVKTLCGRDGIRESACNSTEMTIYAHGVHNTLSYTTTSEYVGLSSISDSNDQIVALFTSGAIYE